MRGARVRSEWVVYGGRLSVFVPRTFQVTPGEGSTEDVQHDYTVTIDIEDGRLVCTNLVIGQSDSGPPVNTDAVRRADIYEWMSSTSVTQNLVFDRIEDDSGGVELEFHTAPDVGFNSHGMTTAALDQFSQHYAYLMVTGQRPSGVFLRDYSMPRPTVTRWLNSARSRKILIEQHERIDHDG